VRYGRKMDNRRKSLLGLGCGGSGLLILLLIKIIARGLPLLNLEIERNVSATAYAATEVVCTDVDRAWEQIGKYGCWHGVVDGLATSTYPSLNIWFFKKRGEPTVIAKSDYAYLGDIQNAYCVHLWGTVQKDSNTDIIYILIDDLKPIEVYSDWISC